MIISTAQRRGEAFGLKSKALLDSQLPCCSCPRSQQALAWCLSASASSTGTMETMTGSTHLTIVRNKRAEAWKALVVGVEGVKIPYGIHKPSAPHLLQNLPSSSSPLGSVLPCPVSFHDLTTSPFSAVPLAAPPAPTPCPGEPTHDPSASDPGARIPGDVRSAQSKHITHCRTNCIIYDS